MTAVSTKVKSQRSASANCPREIRVAYCYFHKKREMNAAGVPFVYGPDHPKAGQPNPRYSGSFMFPKLSLDPAQCANYSFLWGLAVEAARKMWPQSVDATGNWAWPAGAQLAIADGDVPYKKKLLPGQPAQSAEDIALKNAWRRGYWIVEAENFLDPGPRIGKVIGATEADLPSETMNGVVQYKSGDFGVPCLHAYAYQNKTFGVNFGFDGFCFTREGDLIGKSSGPRAAADMFGGVASMVAPGGAPSAPLPTHASPPSAPVSTAPSAPATAPMPTAYAPGSVGGPPMPPVPSAPPLPAFPR
jgi:hypothetical protein